MLNFLSLVMIVLAAFACHEQDIVSQEFAILDGARPFNFVSQNSYPYSSVGDLTSERVQGTAFLVGADILATNFHMTLECTRELCPLLYKGRYELELITRRLGPDLALLRIKGSPEGMKPLPIAIDPSYEGNITMIQEHFTPSRALSSDPGAIKRSERQSYWTSLEYEINTKNGSSGSPILNESGFVVGIHSGGDSKVGLNKGTGADSLHLILDSKLQEQLTLLLQALRTSGDKSLRFDIAELLLDAKSQSPELLADLVSELKTQKEWGDLVRYFTIIRKFDWIN